MSRTTLFKCTITHIAALVMFYLVGPTQAALVITTDNQHGSAGVYPFTPTWTQATDSLIAGLAPSSASGNFANDLTNRNVNTLTAGGSLAISTLPGNAGPDPIGNTTTSSNYVSCGRSGGTQLVYTLPSPGTYGYNLTNITVFGGWADNGRDAVEFTVWYSTVANPTQFKPLAFVNYNPSVAGGTPTANRVMFTDSAGSFIAPNVAAIMFDFLTPWGENNWGGVAAITVEGDAATATTNLPLAITCSNQLVAASTPPSWTIETDSLIAGMTPSVTGGGNFANETGVTGLTALTDGTFGNVDSKGSYATCGANAGTSATYTLNSSAYGSDITNIVIYSGWPDNGRDGQFVAISYSTVAAPSTFVPIGNIVYNPIVAGGTPSANRVQISSSNGGPLAQQVYNIKFDFSSQAGNMDNGYSGYAELIVEGHDSATPPPPPSPILVQDTLPAYAETVVGDQVVLTAAFSNAPPVNLQWQFISGGTTNDVAGATSAALTLNNVQTTSSGYYQLKAVNATNSAAAPSYTTPVQVVVNSTPTPVNGISVNYAGQCGLGAASSTTNFTPSWTINTNNDLILGSQNGTGAGTFIAGAGNYGESGANFDPTILTDGSFGFINYWPGVGSSQTECTCGVTPAGESLTYTLNLASAPYGFDLTNITVYGGWGDAGRNEQKYQVLYSTVAAPTTFNALVTVDYNPNDPSGGQSATRTTLVPTSTALVRSVAAVEINFDLVGAPPKNGYEGYSEIIVSGVPSAPVPTLTNDITPLTAEDVAGSSLTLTAGFSGATSYQWQKNGVNISGATSQTLTLNNLQLSDTATNGGYQLVAINASGSSITRGCSLIVDQKPAAVSNVVTSFAYQTSDQANFAPTWDTSMLSTSLIYQQSPPAGGYDPVGNFNDPDPNLDSHGLAGGLPVLTDGNYGVFENTGPHPAFATCGPTAGQYIIYTLGSAANGYDVTNIQVAGGWNDAGRDSQFYTVSYSTVANPVTFIPLVAVTNSPNVGDYSVIRATFTPGSGLLASNVYAIQVDFTQPPNVPNGYSGYSEVSVYGAPSAADTLPILVTAQNQNPVAGTSPTWTIETNSLIEGQLPNSVGPGAFAGNFNNEPQAGGLPVLTAGVFGPVDAPTTYATCGGAFGAGSSITYAATYGWNLTNIVVYSGWGNYNRDGQFYNISYSTLSAPSTFVPLVSVGYNPTAQTGPSANRVNITPASGIYLATNVYAVNFDFTPQKSYLDNGYSGYAQIVLQGFNLASPVPPGAFKTAFAGGNLTVSGSGGTPNTGYTFLTTTNLLAPPGNWTVAASGVLDGNGAFTNVIPINPTQPASFFRLRMP